ncbi:hypothetical protein Sjap_011621 [Stephania japonica]|uniref:Uncharacterized protein n=1 Tax=Stephania japonica TaxID=461633 RepID=A0AAP0JBY4_9MAGN
MADKASRGVVVYGDGLVRFIDPSHAHIHEIASRGSCGFLSLRDSPSPTTEDEDERIVRELAQLLDAYDFYIMKNAERIGGLEGSDVSSLPTLPKRFMGLRAAILTNNSRVKSFATELGITPLELDEFIGQQSLNEKSLSRLLLLLGFKEGKILEVSEFDLLFIHVGLSGKEGTQDVEALGTKQIKLVNELIGAILQRAQPGTDILSRLHFSLVVSYGALSDDEDCNSTSLLSQQSVNHNLSLLIPRQSYSNRGSNFAPDIRNYCPMLIAQWQEAVTRKDTTVSFSFKEFKECGANLAIPAERFLHEVAFKLWKAPKYGA